MKMRFKKHEDFGSHIKKHYEDISKKINSSKQAFADYCDTCKHNTRFEIEHTYILNSDDSADFIPANIAIRCPTCEEYSVLLVFLDKKYLRYSSNVYLIDVFPPQNRTEDLPDNLPPEYVGVKKSYTEAMKCWNGKAYMAASVMFRRCLEIFLRDVLGIKAPSKKLDDEIKMAEVQGKIKPENAINSELLQKIGNDAAHPNSNVEFTEDDAAELHRYLLEIIDENFVIPEAMNQARKDILERRKKQLQRVAPQELDNEVKNEIDGQI